MNYIDATFCDNNQIPLATAQVPDIEGGWWVFAIRKDEHQSWERPFSVGLVASESQELTGHALFADTGEAFAYHEQKTSAMPGMSAPPMMSMMGMPMMPPMPQMPEFRMPMPETGRPMRRFPGIAEYLDEYAMRNIPDSGPQSMREGTLRRLTQMVVGETEQDALRREANDRNRWNLDLAPLNGRVFNYVTNKVLNRTVMGVYEYETAGGIKVLLLAGAQFQGHDTLMFRAQTGITSIPDEGYPFGQAPLGDAAAYDVQWMAVMRFGGICAVNDPYAKEFPSFAVRLFHTLRFDASICEERKQREKAFKDAHEEAHKRDLEGLRQLSREMHEDNRRKQAISDWEDVRRRERKMESDRRIREGWSAVIRGVDRYVGPDGRIWEMPMRGPGYRAYYDRLSGDVIHTDGVPPIGWEELPRWQ